MTNKDLISQYVDTGMTIPKYQFDKLSNNDKTTYFRKRLMTLEHSAFFLRGYEFSMLSEEQKRNSIKYLDVPKLETTLHYNSKDYKNNDNNELIYGLIGVDEFMDMFNEWIFDLFLRYADDDSELIGFLLTKRNFVSNINGSIVSELFRHSNDKERIIDFILKNNVYKDSLDDMIKYSKDVESTIDKLLNTHGFLSSLDYYELSEFMNEVFNKISMPDLPFKIVSHKEETSEWFWKSFWVLFDFTDRPSDLLLQMGVENAQDFLSSIPDKKLTELIDYSDDSEELIAVLKKFGRI